MKTPFFIMIFLSLVFCACLAAPAHAEEGSKTITPQDPWHNPQDMWQWEKKKQGMMDEMSRQGAAQTTQSKLGEQKGPQPDHQQFFHLSPLDQAEKDLESIVTALESQTGALDPQAVNRALNAVADKLLTGQSDFTATVAGSLNRQSGPEGSFGFQVNLSSGGISNARMSGSDASNQWGGGTFSLSGGSGILSGNNFNVNGLSGTASGTYNGAATGSLEGAAANGFKNLGDSITRGTYTVKKADNTELTSGTLSGGRVN
jgi:hypothetical protein